MQIDWIDTFLDLAETSSFNRTADRLGVTQSTVSGRLKALETALGVRLFERSRAGAQITTEGLQFEPHARLIRQDWTRARRSVAKRGTAAATLQLGIQSDLAQAHMGPLVAEMRQLLPQTAFYVESDYSTQMCSDLVSGSLDFSVLFTPKPHADLHFETVGSIPYRLISLSASSLKDIDPATYVLANFAPAFQAAHRTLLPELSIAPLSAGQSSAIEALITATGGSGYVMAPRAKALVLSGGFQIVADAPVIEQAVYAATHLRDRTSGLHKRLVRLVRSYLATQ